MSRETAQWLNTMTLIGFTEKRGNAWHYRADLQGDEPNHYPGAIPVEDVRRRLFPWEVVEGEVTITVRIGDDDVVIPADDFKALIHPEYLARARAGQGSYADSILHIPGSGYVVHNFGTHLLDRVATVLDDDLKIGSAGVLRRGKLAWVQVEVDETQQVEGVEYRPFLTASTSHDGMISNRLQRNVQLVVCDNTLACARGERGQGFALRHTKNSNAEYNVAAAREHLGLLVKASDEFQAEVQRLTSAKITPGQFTKWVESISGLTDARKTAEPSKRTISGAEAKTAELKTLWNSDPRVQPWMNTAYGLVACWNTWVHHFQAVQGAGKKNTAAEANQARAAANQLRVVRGYVGQVDDHALRTLAKVGGKNLLTVN